MGIPPEMNMEQELFKCDACRATEGLGPNSFPAPRRDRAGELAAAAAAEAERKLALANKAKRKGSRNRPLSQRQREALQDAEQAPVRGKAEIEVAQKRAKARADARAAKKAQKVADKAEGLDKQQRAAKRSQERAKRKQERTNNKARQEKEGLKNLLASFDHSSGDDSSSSDDSSEDDDSDSSEEIKPTAVTPKSKSTTAGAASSTTVAAGAASPSAAAAAARPLAKVTPLKQQQQPTPSANALTAGKSSLQEQMWEPIRAKVASHTSTTHHDQHCFFFFFFSLCLLSLSSVSSVRRAVVQHRCTRVFERCRSRLSKQPPPCERVCACVRVWEEDLMKAAWQAILDTKAAGNEPTRPAAAVVA